jgi:hypothetical protein
MANRAVNGIEFFGLTQPRSGLGGRSGLGFRILAWWTRAARNDRRGFECKCDCGNKKERFQHGQPPQVQVV